jgi:hypothetical protein
VEGIGRRAARFGVAGGPHSAAIPQGTFEAIREDPGRVAQRTPSAVLGSLAGLGDVLMAFPTAAAQGRLEPIRQMLEEQGASAKELAGFFSGDPDTVRDLTLRYGLAPHLTAAIGPIVGGARAMPARRTAARLRGTARVSQARPAARGAPPVFRATERRQARRRVSESVSHRESALEARQAQHMSPLVGRLRGGVVQRLSDDERDLVAFLAPARISDNPAFGLAQAWNIRRRLERRNIDPENLTPDARDDLWAARYITENPGVLRNPDVWAAVDAVRERAPLRRPETISEQRALNRARQEQAYEYGVAMPRESVAGQARGRMKEARALRTEARGERRRALAAETRASERRRGLVESVRVEQRLRGRKALGEDALLATRPPARVVRRSQEIDKLEAGAKVSRQRADELDALARQTAKEGQELRKVWRSQDYSHEAFVRAQEQFDREYGLMKTREQLPDPVYVRALNAHSLIVDDAGIGRTGKRYRQVALGREKLSTGRLLRQGLVDRRWEVLVAESVARPLRVDEHNRLIRMWTEDEQLEVGGKRVFTSQRDVNAAVRQFGQEGRRTKKGRSTSQVVPVRVSEIERAFDESSDRDLLSAVRDAADPEQPAKPGDRWIIVDREAHKELAYQLDNAQHKWEFALNLNRAQAYAVLGTSPGWLLSQVPATLVAPMLTHPVQFMRGVRRYHTAPEDLKVAYASMADAPHGLGMAATESVHGLRRGMVEMEYEAVRAMSRSMMRRNLGQVPQIIRNLERNYTIFVRKSAAAGAADLEFRRARGSFYRATAKLSRDSVRLYDEMHEALRAMRDLDLDDQRRYMVNHPEVAKRIHGYMDEILGNWRAISSRERYAAVLGFFYPFLRWSLRFTWRHFPNRHPVKATILSYLGTAHVAELQRLLGVYPDWLTTMMSAVLYSGDRPSEGKLVNFARFSPGGNALVEAGIQGFDMRSLRLAQPIFGAVAEGLYGYDTQRERPVLTDDSMVNLYTGQISYFDKSGGVTHQAPSFTRGGLVMNELLRLATPARLGLLNPLHLLGIGPKIGGPDVFMQKQERPAEVTAWDRALPTEKEKARASLLGTSVIGTERQRTLEHLGELSDRRGSPFGWASIRSQLKRKTGTERKRYYDRWEKRRLAALEADRLLREIDPKLGWKPETRKSALAAPLISRGRRGGVSAWEPRRGQSKSAWTPRRAHKWDQPASNVPDW